MAFETMFEPLETGPYFDYVAIYSESITEAIEDGLLVEFDYKGFHRIVAPYELGQTVRGDYLLRGFQAAGGSFGLRVEGWKLFRLDYISYLEVSDEEFSPRADYWVLPEFWTHEPIIVLRRE